MASNTNDPTLIRHQIDPIHQILENAKQHVYSPSFHILDHEDDDVDDSHLTERQKWIKIEEDFNLEYEFDNIALNLQEDDDGGSDELFSLIIQNESISTTDENQVIVEEQVLSQRLSQLSTVMTTIDDDDDDDYESIATEQRKRRRRLPVCDTSSESVVKKCCTTIDDNEEKEAIIPHYLLAQNQLFERIIVQVLDHHHPTANDFDELRQLAFFMHKRMEYDLLHQLWSAYLQSGTGILKKKSSEIDDIPIDVDRRYWPKPVTSLIQLSSESKEQEQLAYETIVNEKLTQYQQKIDDYQRQLNEKKQHLAQIWTSVLEATIQTFIQQYGLIGFEMKCKTKIGLLMHAYEDELIRRQYQQHQSTTYQKEIAQVLYRLELELETNKYQLIQNQERLIYNRPPIIYDTLENSFPFNLHLLTDRVLCQQLSYRYEKLIQETKTDLMAMSIFAQQVSIYQLQKKFNVQLDQMHQNDHEHIPNKEMPKLLKRFIHQRSLYMHKYLKLKHEFTLNYFIHHSYDQLELFINQGHTKTNRSRIGFLPNLLIDPMVLNTSSHLLTNQQLQFLKRGPTYIPPGQLHISSLFQINSDIIVKQYTFLKHQLALVFDKFHVSIVQASHFQKDAYETFKQIFSLALPTDLYQRALQEKQLIQSIQRFLNKYHLCLRRTSDQTNLFYLTTSQQLTTLSNQYMETNTKIYQLLMNANESDIQEQLHKKYQAINIALEKLFNEKRFKTQVHQRLRLKFNQIKLPYLYFLPDISITTSSSLLQVQPMIVAHHSATSNIAQYLHQLLRPLFTRFMNETIFMNEADWLNKLHTHIYQEKHFSPTTHFVTIHITNFHTMASHESIINSLDHFLNYHLVTNKLQYTSLRTLNRNQWISIDTIKKLTELYLENNFFYYDRQIYRLSQGTGPNSFLFSDLLANIYLYTYDKFITTELKLTTEFYGRYKNRVFFTWNRTTEELQLFLGRLQKNYSHIQIELSFGQRIHYFNAQIENRQGHLYTCVYHASNVPKYCLPYVINPTKLNHCLWFRSALIRAIRFCSNYLDFLEEQNYLAMTCLTNGYSRNFIETQLQHFYLRFNAEKIRYCLDPTVYERLRQRCLDLIQDQRINTKKLRQLEDEEYLLNFSYSYDYGSYFQFNQKFHQLWSQYLKHDEQLSHKDTKINLNPKQIFSSNTLFAREKPSDEFYQTLLKKTYL